MPFSDTALVVANDLGPQQVNFSGGTSTPAAPSVATVTLQLTSSGQRVALANVPLADVQSQFPLGATVPVMFGTPSSGATP